MTSYRMLYCCVLRVVLDTSVMAAALRSRTGASFLVLRAVQLRRLVLLATASLFLEYEDVLKRDEQREVSGFTLGDVDALLEELAGTSGTRPGSSQLAAATARSWRRAGA